MNSDDSAAPALKKTVGVGTDVPSKCDFWAEAPSILHSGSNPTLQVSPARIRRRL